MTTTIFAANGARLPVYITRYKADLRYAPTTADYAALARITHAVYHAKEYDLLFRGTLSECTEFCADRQSVEATRAAYARMAA